eukprot:scaffold2490_cov236-Chaetoceros_neogracile.AAC.8
MLQYPFSWIWLSQSERREPLRRVKKARLITARNDGLNAPLTFPPQHSGLSAFVQSTGQALTESTRHLGSRDDWDDDLRYIMVGTVARLLLPARVI